MDKNAHFMGGIRGVRGQDRWTEGDAWGRGAVKGEDEHPPPKVDTKPGAGARRGVRLRTRVEEGDACAPARVKGRQRGWTRVKEQGGGAADDKRRSGKTYHRPRR